jgi:hypothetical protein
MACVGAQWFVVTEIDGGFSVHRVLFANADGLVGSAAEAWPAEMWLDVMKQVALLVWMVVTHEKNPFFPLIFAFVMRLVQLTRMEYLPRS